MSAALLAEIEHDPTVALDNSSPDKVQAAVELKYVIAPVLLPPDVPKVKVLPTVPDVVDTVSVA